MHQHMSILVVSSDLRVDREKGSNPGDSFPLVDAPPDEPGGEVVDQEGH